MTSCPTIHIVTPTFNSADDLERTLASVASQAGDFLIHHHVSDGGSSDGTVDILRRWSQYLAYGLIPLSSRGVRFTTASGPDEGVFDAIAKGFAHLDIGDDDWMGWIGCGDILMPGALAALAAADRQLGVQRVGWAGGRAREARDHLVLTDADRPHAAPIIRQGLCDGLHFDAIQSQGVFFRHRLWRQVDPVRDFARFRAAGDWNLWRLFAGLEPFRQFGFALAERGGGGDRIGSDAWLEEIDRTAPPEVRERAVRRLLRSPPRRSVIAVSPSGRLSLTEADMGAGLKDRAEARLGTAAPATGLTDDEFSQLPAILAHDADWQFPAITEQHACRQAQVLLPRAPGVTYLGFAWATLIDRMKNDRPDTAALRGALEALTAPIPSGARVVTVCQHIHLDAVADLMERVGVTDVFWSHARRGETMMGGLAVHPFPLYPVQRAGAAPDEAEEGGREHLFSFVGARANEWYMSEVRDWILDELVEHPRGVIRGRDSWHYNRIVYDFQINREAGEGDALIEEDASADFRSIMRDSVFALCPSGSGPNSIRLWEALGAGTIPVILSEDWAPPGDEALWKAAAVFCDETREAVCDLPARLETLAADPGALAALRHAGRQLWMKYGPETFIYDIQRLYLDYSVQEGGYKAEAAAAAPRQRVKVFRYGRHGGRAPTAYAPISAYLSGDIEFVETAREADILLVAFDRDIVENASEIFALLDLNPALRLVVLSEEPVWDTVWSTGYSAREHDIALGARTVRVTVLNHVTSDIFKFRALPYFVTTSNDFIVRYAALFARNAQRTPAQWLDHWAAAPIRAAFYCENRQAARFDIADPRHDLVGLCGYRSRLAAACSGEGVIRVGMGWDSDTPRQALADWHLDKLAGLHDRARAILALENTHHPDYITEKLFDAYAAGGIPAYYAGPAHRVHELVPAGSFVNLHGLDEGEGARLMLSFQPDARFAQAYADAQSRLAALFSDIGALDAERRRIAGEIAAGLKAVMQR